MHQKTFSFRIVPLPGTARRPGFSSRLLSPLGSALGAILKRVFKRLAERRIANMHHQGPDAVSCEWRSLNNRVDERFARPYLIVNAPRWNPHAAIFTAGPFEIDGEWSFDRADLDQSGAAWCLVIYDAKTGETVSWASSLTDGTEKGLAAGVYGAGLRIYHPKPTVTVPSLSSRSTELVPPLEMPSGDVKPLQETVFHLSSAFYRALHTPVLSALMAARETNDQALAERYLPVGNPETVFVFGAAPAGYGVRLDATAINPGTALVYCTVYNSASFPEAAIEVAPGAVAEIPARNGARSYLVRIVPLVAGVETRQALMDALEVSVVPA